MIGMDDESRPLSGFYQIFINYAMKLLIFIEPKCYFNLT